MGETLNEADFRRRLADLVQRYDEAAAPGTKESDDAWWDEWQDLLDEATEDQARRADKLLTLHAWNRYDGLHAKGAR